MADTSFLPEDYIDKRAAKRTNLICVTLFVVVMTAVVGAYFFSDQQRVEVRDRLAVVNANVAQAGLQLEKLAELQNQKDKMVRKANITGTLVEKFPRSLILSQLINNMPSTLSLFELELETAVTQQKVSRSKTALAKAKQAAKAKAIAGAQPDVPEPPKTRISIQITGVARTDVEVAQFMNDLSKLAMFASVNLGFSEEIKIQDEAMRKFKIEAVINNEMEVTQYKPLLVKRDLKQNPMGNTININQDGQFVQPKRSAHVKNATDNQ